VGKKERIVIYAVLNMFFRVREASMSGLERLTMFIVLSDPSHLQEEM
jgi:hypothetical protein